MDFDISPFPRRRQRADLFTAQVMQIIGKYICEHTQEPLYRQASRELCAFFSDDGFDIVTDRDRAAAGLPPRDANGWTAQELYILEAKRRELMVQPILPMPPLEMKK